MYLPPLARFNQACINNTGCYLCTSFCSDYIITIIFCYYSLQTNQNQGHWYDLQFTVYLEVKTFVVGVELKQFQTSDVFGLGHDKDTVDSFWTLQFPCGIVCIFCFFLNQIIKLKHFCDIYKLKKYFAFILFLLMSYFPCLELQKTVMQL